MTEILSAIEIAGGGASATLVLAHLAKHQNAANIKNITVFDREGRFARGVAYSTENPLHLLNVRAANMSALQEDPTHFTRWLTENGHAFKAGDFVPRVIYAQYLKNLWDDAVRHLKTQGCNLMLKTENFSVGTAPIKIIATGNASPVAPPGAERLTAHDGYYSSPWQIDYASLGDHIVVVGTGLSMIDTVMALHAAGFKGYITAISRHGLIPAVHTDPAVYPAYYDKKFPKTALALLRDIRTHVAAAEKQGIPWQAVIDSLRPVTNPIWLSLNEKEKKKIRELGAFWNVHRHRMAPVAAIVIKGLRESGQLKVVKDRIVRLEKSDEKAKINVIGANAAHKADYVVNCLGYKPDQDLKYDIEQEKSGIYALGPALSGIYFETTAIPEIRAQAARIAHEILK